MAPRKDQEASQCWKKLVISNTPDCGAILSLCHFSSNILIQHPVSSHTTCLCPPCFTCTNFFLLLRLAKLIPFRACVHAALSPQNASPAPPHIYMIGLFAVRSQSNITFVYPVGSSPQPVTLFQCHYPVLVSSFTEVILVFVGLFRVL